MLLKFAIESLKVLLELGRRFSHLLNDVVVRQVFQAIMDVRSLMMHLKKPLSCVEEPRLRLRHGLSVSKVLGVLNNLVEHGLVLVEVLSELVVLVLPAQHVFDAFSLVLGHVLPHEEVVRGQAQAVSNFSV